MNTQTPVRKQNKFISLQRMKADRLLTVWREKYSAKLKGFDAVRAIRTLRDGKYR